jgi:hypothetical protein
MYECVLQCGRKKKEKNNAKTKKIIVVSKAITEMMLKN